MSHSVRIEILRKLFLGIHYVPRAQLNQEGPLDTNVLKKFHPEN